MKKLYLIAYSEAYKREELIAHLETAPQAGKWFYSMPNSLFVYVNMSACELYEFITKKFGKQNRIFVTEVPSRNSQGWIPSRHWDIIHANCVVHEYELKFEGYWLDRNREYLPTFPGIYCVYASIYNADRDTVTLDRLLYIGKAENVRQRHQNHEKRNEWLAELRLGETLSYCAAAVQARSLKVCEAAMIYQHKPKCNDVGKDGYHHQKTHVRTSGRNALMQTDFTLDPTD